MKDVHSAFDKLLKELKLEIEFFDPEKKRLPLKLKGRSAESVKALHTNISSKWILSPNIIQYAPLAPYLQEPESLFGLLEDYCDEKGLLYGGAELEQNEVYPDLELYMDQESKDGDLFTAYKDNMRLAPVSGKAFVSQKGWPPKSYNQIAKPVARRYEPRKPLGEYSEVDGGKTIKAFNTYIPPRWKDVIDDVEVSKEPPELFKKLIEHLVPLKEEREFLYSWLHFSLYKRAYTFLVLCGSPGIGKNIFKKIARALHGFENTVDGKKSTFSDRFNKQLQNCTLLWFDELRYNEDNENAMKEVQNDTIAIEGKGVDATRSTRIHASMVIVNNKPRDNYIDFESRKFVPLQLNRDRLEVSMKPAEISKLVNKIEDPASPTFDLEYIAEIAEWIKKYGKSQKWPTLEYHGPMFYKLAHTSMTRWQKKTVQLIIEFMDRCPGKVDLDEEKGMRWSTILKVEDSRKAGKGLTFPSHSSVEAFLESFRDGYGRECFETTPHDGKMNIDEDFWVKCIVDEIKIFNKQDLKTRKTGDSDVKKTPEELGRGKESKREVATKQKERKNKPDGKKELRRKALLNGSSSRGNGRRHTPRKESVEDLL